jgi:hypothetical protein
MGRRNNKSTLNTCYFGDQYGDDRIWNIHVCTNAEVRPDNCHKHPEESQRLMEAIDFLQARYREAVETEARREAIKAIKDAL